MWPRPSAATWGEESASVPSPNYPSGGGGISSPYFCPISTILWEDEEVAQRFKGFVLEAERQGAHDEGGVRNESMIVVEVHAEAHR